MAIATNVDDKNDASGYVAASYCDRNRLYVLFNMDIDADMPPLAADFCVLRDQHVVKTQSIDIQINDQQSMVVLVMNDTHLPGDELCLRYKPTQWLMCELVSGNAIDAFEETIYPKPLDALEPSLRLLTKFEPTLAPESVVLDERPVSVRYASEFRIQLIFQSELDSAVTIDVNDFRAETDDRWVRVTAARYVPARENAKSEVLLELSEPLAAGTRLSLGYRSPNNRLRTIDADAIAPFTTKCVFTETDDEQDQSFIDDFDDDVPQLVDIVQTPRHSSKELAGHSDALLQDDLLDEQESVKQPSGDPETALEDIGESAENEKQPEPEPVVKKEVVVRAKTITEEGGTATVISSVKDPAIAAAIAEKAERFRQSLEGKSEQAAVKIELSAVAKAIYFVPIVVLGWLIFIVCVYLATIVFDINIPDLFGSPSSDTPTSAAQRRLEVSREQCSLTSEDGSTYEGQCVNGERDGFGSYVWTSGNRYDGNWKNGKRHGEGTLVYASGAVYKGNYRGGKEHGQGTMIWPNGANYDGEYRDGRFHGKGTYVTAEGHRFEGIFESGSMTQEGRCILHSGEQYPGPCQG